MTDYDLRPAAETDFVWLRDLHHATMRALVEAIWGWDDAWQDAYFRAHFDPGQLRIIQHQGRDVGVLDVEVRADEIYLGNILIAPREQGKGIGTAVIRDLQAQAAARRTSLTLQVLRGNRARDLYERLGFNVIGETEIHYQMQWNADK